MASMKIIKGYKLLFVLLTAGLLFSCTKEVQIDIPGFKEQLVIDGFIETDQPPLVLISRSKDIYSPTDLDAFLSGFVSGAEVTMSDGTNTYTLDEVCTDNLPPGTEEIAAAIFGIPASELANYHLCAYTSFNTAAWGQLGKTYTLSVTFEGKTYTGSTQILQPTALDSLWWEAEPDTPGYGFSYAILSDPAASYDAYKWEVRRLNQGDDGNPIDARFQTTFNPVWDDEFVNGKTFEFFYENPMTFYDEEIEDQYRGLYKQGDTVVVKLSKMDRGVYEFMINKYTQIATTGNPFSSPTNIVSNLDGGCLGVWAGYAPWFDTLVCQP